VAHDEELVSAGGRFRFPLNVACLTSCLSPSNIAGIDEALVRSSWPQVKLDYAQWVRQPCACSTSESVTMRRRLATVAMFLAKMSAGVRVISI
jgi:hypothetical protein